MSQSNDLAIKHLNHGLFSDHYLDTIDQTDSKWQLDDLFLEIKEIRDSLKALLQTLQPEKLSESQLEEEWIRPVLRQLGHHFQVQINIRFRKSRLIPDYVLAANASDASQLTKDIYTPKEIRHCLAVADAKAWGTNLDQAKSKTDRNPSQQIDDYIRYSELKWGILTDGRYWRLYERNTSKNNVYYAVDLVTLLEQGTPQDFYYFYFFFQQSAFLPDGWLDNALADSITYAEELSEKLEDEVYDALTFIAQGFLDYQRNWRGTPQPDLNQVYTQSLVLLYRLLFILYAESRNILPMKTNLTYAQERSLTALKREVTTMIDFEPFKLARRVEEGAYYEKLSTLFYNLDVGSPHYNITAYNGRLFSDSEYPFLADKRVGDSYMAHALDKLTRIDVKNGKKSKRVFVDYRDLDVRHLGAIYEKLLEYELAIAESDLALKGKKYVKTKNADKALVKAGQVYLRTGNNERKVTGSYYTPDYIVSFIVSQSLDPLLNDITDRYATLKDDGTWDIRDTQALRDAILNLNVLDPATGSGHFMVEVVNQIASWLTKLNLLPSDIQSDEQELTYWKRQVVSACVYGVDVNPLAVELAKLSLWLTTIARDNPLSFLDHHVRLGNTLVGARVTQLTPNLNPTDAPDDAPQQLDLFASSSFAEGVSAAVTTMQAIEGMIASDVKDVKQQEQDYTQVFDKLTPWRKLAHVWTARHFGLKLTVDQWADLYHHTLEQTPLPDDLATIVTEADRLHDHYHFLHWDFAFPEVFFDEQGTPLPNGGFDAVVGNPPYVRQERIKPYKTYFESHYEVYSGTADLFLYFYERGLTLIRPSQRLGYVTSGTFMNTNSAKSFRQYIHKNSAFETVVNFGENQPFKGAEMVFPTIAILKKDKPQPKFKSLFVDGVYPRAELGESLALPLSDTLSEVTAMDEWRFQPVELTELFKKVIGKHPKLSQSIDDKIYAGIKTGLNDAFIISTAKRNELINLDAKSQEIIKPMLQGTDLRPWYTKKTDSHIIFSYQGIDIDNYPAIKNHLSQYREQLEPKPENWSKRQWEGRKAGSYRWFELQDQVAYYKELEKPKIYLSKFIKLPRFSWDNAGTYSINTVHFFVPSNISMLSLLNSRVHWFVLSQICVPLRLRAGLWQYVVIPQFLNRLPIPDLTPSQERQLAEYAEEITGLAQSRYALHEAVRHRISSDLGHDEGKLNTKMTAWWDLDDFKIFQTELKKSYKGVTIPVSARDEWEKYWLSEKSKHDGLTTQIVALETDLNAVVYDAFDLTPAEQNLIEKATKYPYGAV